MKELIQALSWKAEIAIVIWLAFGLFLYSNIVMLLTGQVGTPETTSISTEDMRFLIGYEFTVTVVLSAFLIARGWTLERLGFRFRASDVLAGVAMILASYALWAMATRFTTVVAQEAMEASAGIYLSGGSIPISTVLTVSCINGLFEELFVCAYVISALEERKGQAFAVNVSTAVRVTYHLYQGLSGVVWIIPLGLLFAYWYARTRRVWPIVIAHIALDILGLSALSGLET